MNLEQFFRYDRRRSLFPLDSTAILLKGGEKEIRDYVYNSIFNQGKPSAGFLPGVVSFANKDKYHLRKVYILDPLASFYLYDFVLRNALSFQKQASSKRQFFGYSFQGNSIVNAFNDYHQFRRKKYDLKKNYKYYVRADISNCFSSFYHHDIVSHLSHIVSGPESIQFGQYLREIAGGRTIDCLPQGYFPAKAIGNKLLSFTEQSRALRSSAIIRFIDDYFLFSGRMSTLEQDILSLQHVLSDMSLQLNSAKTRLGSSEEDFEDRDLDPIKKRLVSKREKSRNIEYEEEDEEDNDETRLTEEEQEYLINILRNPMVPEEDIELALSLLSVDLDVFMTVVESVMTKYPHLIKTLYTKVAEVDDKGKLWASIRSKSKDKKATEFELFWLTRMILDHYDFDDRSATILHRIYAHQNTTEVVRAAILETEENGYGLEEIKRQTLRNCGASLEGVAAAVGLRKTEKARRNHAYKYAAKSGEQMALYIKVLFKF